MGFRVLNLSIIDVCLGRNLEGRMLLQLGNILRRSEALRRVSAGMGFRVMKLTIMDVSLQRNLGGRSLLQ
jgi:hypothetical protein